MTALHGAPFVGFIPVRDADAAQFFYERQLGLEVIEKTPFALVLDANGTMLRITPVGEFTPHPFTIAGFDVSEIDSSVRELAARGVVFTRYDFIDQDALGIWAAPSGARVAWFRDLDGNTLSLTTFADGA